MNMLYVHVIYMCTYIYIGSCKVTGPAIFGPKCLDVVTFSLPAKRYHVGARRGAAAAFFRFGAGRVPGRFRPEKRYHVGRWPAKTLPRRATWPDVVTFSTG